MSKLSLPLVLDSFTESVKGTWPQFVVPGLGLSETILVIWKKQKPFPVAESTSLRIFLTLIKLLLVWQVSLLERKWPVLIAPLRTFMTLVIMTTNFYCLPPAKTLVLRFAFDRSFLWHHSLLPWKMWWGRLNTIMLIEKLGGIRVWAGKKSEVLYYHPNTFPN